MSFDRVQPPRTAFRGMGGSPMISDFYKKTWAGRPCHNE
jgi:hypothetical protein